MSLRWSGQRGPPETSKQTKKLGVDCGGCMRKRRQGRGGGWLVGAGGSLPGRVCKGFSKERPWKVPSGLLRPRMLQEGLGEEHSERSERKGLEVGPAPGTEVIRCPSLRGGHWGPFLYLELPSLAFVLHSFLTTSLALSEPRPLGRGAVNGAMPVNPRACCLWPIASLLTLCKVLQETALPRLSAGSGCLLPASTSPAQSSGSAGLRPRLQEASSLYQPFPPLWRN